MKTEIYEHFKKYIIEIVKDKYPQKRTRKYSFEYYLENFVHVLNDFVKWSSLQFLDKKQKSYHWKSIYNEFNKWTKDNVFEEAFYKFINSKYFKISKVKKDKNINLFIDVTKIANHLGSEGIAINGEYKKKNVTNLTIICDQNKLPLSVSCLATNKIIYNGRKTSVHEIKNVQNTLNNINLPIKDYINLNLIGDRGYISQEKFKIMGRKLNTITPKRKNQHTKNTNKEKNLLKNRHIIENLFATIKSNNRLIIRKDKKLNNYLSFLYMNMLELHIKHALKNKSNRYL
jgi:hypothetical protein